MPQKQCVDSTATTETSVPLTEALAAKSHLPVTTSNSSYRPAEHSKGMIQHRADSRPFDGWTVQTGTQLQTDTPAHLPTNDTSTQLTNVCVSISPGMP